MKIKILPILLLLACSIASYAQQNTYLITGTYASAKSEGIYVYRFDATSGSAAYVSMTKVSNPSFVAVSPDEKFVYAVEEDANANGTGGQVSAFSFNKNDGTLHLINRQATGGNHPCYVTVDKTGKWLVAGNYSSGSLAVFSIEANGGLGPGTITRHEGSGPNKARQASPHVHATFFSADNRYLFVPDLGIDKLMIYAFDENTGNISLAKQPFTSSEPGAGPRHICFNPVSSFAYLVEELSGTVVTYKFKKGKLKQKQRISTMPAGDTSFAGSADIHVSPDGKFLYASNRAEANTIAIFSIDRRTGKLTPGGHQSSLGKTPRNFNFDPSGNFLLVANQNSDQIVVFKINKDTGLLTDTGNRIDVGKPVCLKWIGVK